MCSIGIDIGNSFCRIGIYLRDEEVVILGDDYGCKSMPSYVTYLDETEFIVGNPARNFAPINVSNSISDIKRVLSQPINGTCYQNSCNSEIMTHSLSILIGHMKSIAENEYGEVMGAVISVPDSMNRAYRSSIVAACALMNIHILRLASSGVAAAYAYAPLNREARKNVVFVNLGGSSLDVTVCVADCGVLEVVATGGRTDLGGVNFDESMVEYCQRDIRSRHRTQLEDPRALYRLRQACEQAKRQLSTSLQAVIEVDSLFGSGAHYSTTLTRQDFDHINMSNFRGCMEVVESVLSDAKLPKTNIQEVVLLGGCSRIPMVRQLLTESFLGQAPLTGSNPDLMVVRGLALLAATLSGNCSNDDLVLTVLPSSFGIGTVEGGVSVLVKKNTTLPCKKRATFSACAEGQSVVVMDVYEGDRPLAKDNHLVGQLYLQNIPPIPCGTCIIEVTCDIDGSTDCIITATEFYSGVTNTVHIADGPRAHLPTSVEAWVAAGNPTACKTAAPHEVYAGMNIVLTGFNGDGGLSGVDGEYVYSCSDDVAVFTHQHDPHVVLKRRTGGDWCVASVSKVLAYKTGSSHSLSPLSTWQGLWCVAMASGTHELCSAKVELCRDVRSTGDAPHTPPVAVPSFMVDNMMETGEFRGPLRGIFKDLQLLPLMDALGPIITRRPDIDIARMVMLAERKAKQLATKYTFLSIPQIAAIVLYTAENTPRQNSVRDGIVCVCRALIVYYIFVSLVTYVAVVLTFVVSCGGLLW